MSNLRVLTQIVAFGDGATVSNPKLKYVDWSRDLNGLSVQNPRSESRTIQAGQEALFFDGTRSLTVDGTSALELALVSGYEDRYRIEHTGGTAPGFRTARALDLSGCGVTVTLNANGSAVFAIVSGAATFSSVQAGDTLFVDPDAASQPFHDANQGVWIVLAATSSSVTLQRSGDFEAYGEAAIAVTTALQVQAFSSAGVAAGDKLEITAGFASSSRKTYTVQDVTAKYVEIVSSLPLAEEVGILPGVGGLVVYTSAKQFLHLEADQECVVRVNGDTSEFQRVTPWLAGDVNKPGTYQRVGPTWSLKVLNKSSLPLTVIAISVE